MNFFRKNIGPDGIIHVPQRHNGLGPPTKFEAKKRGLDITGGPIYRTLWLLAGPVILSHLLNHAITLADLTMVGSLGKEAQAALVTSISLLNLLFAIGWGMGFATIAFVSQHSGAGRTREANISAAHSLMFAVLIGVVMIIVGNLFSTQILSFMGSEPEVHDYAVKYTKLLFDYMPFFFLLTLGFSVMQGLGDTVTPLIIMAVINVLNIFLNWIFIFGHFGMPAMGIEGAAIGSVAGRGIGASAIVLILISGRYRMHLKLEHFKPVVTEFWKIIRLGIPNSSQALLRNINVMILYRILSLTNQSTVAQASLGLGFGSEAFGFIPLIGLQIAAGSMVGQNIGAGKIDRAEQSGYAAVKTAFVLMVIVCIAFLTIPDKIIDIFTDDAAVIASASWYLRINAITQLFQSCFVLIGPLRAAGDSARPLYNHIAGQWIIRLPLAWFLSTYTPLDEKGVWLAMAISSMIESSVYYIMFKSGYWKKLKLG